MIIHGATFFEPENRFISHERANTRSAFNAGIRSGYSGLPRFPFPSANHLPVNLPRVFSYPLLSVGVPSGLTFASKVSVFVKKIT